MHRILYGFFICALIPCAAFADVGERLIKVTCDRANGHFEIEPFIAWNEDADQFNLALKKGRQVKDGATYFSLVAIQKGTLHFNCVIKTVKMSVSVRERWNPKLEITQGAKEVAAPEIDDVWQFSGPIFRIRYTVREGWQEACGGEERPPVWAAIDFKRATTNCPPY